MGKASRWMINLFLGKKEEKGNRKNNISFYDDNFITPSATIPSIPNYKRWSFGKSSSKERHHKFSKSLDSITPLITQHAAAAIDWGNQPNKKAKIVAIPQAESVKRLTRNGITKSLEHASATRIQAVFRSYLAKKALCALRALVKIQALVRGHLVRKQTTATMRQMHALMSIQVRARFQRIQMAEESSQLAVRSQSSRHANFSHETGLRGAYKEATNWNIYETERVLKHKHDYLSSSAKRREHRPRKYYSGELSISKRDQEYEFSFSTAHNSPQIRSPTATAIPGRASFTYHKPDYEHPVPSPNYMSNTESSKAKVRSQSEPRQRPILSMRPKGKQADLIDAQTQGLSSHKIEDPWFTKVYSTTKAKNSDCDAKSTGSSSHSNYSKLLVTYEASS
ncbi:protein IQ-DOMAIN 19-like [Euphorbia lathyris]|uniref:protein IQ-DOMAIN 19-like n=1 Tax=Euphorbia lathyris TaxID=212925 RepID=UPI0033142851